MQWRFAMWLCVVSVLIARPVTAGTINTVTNPPGDRFVPATVGIASSTVVEIVNVGSTDLVVSSVAMVGDSHFSVATPAQPITIAPSSSVEVTVSFLATGNSGLLQANLVIASNDPVNPTVQLAFEGCAGPAAVGFDPPSYDFGLVAIYSPVLHARVINAGCDVLTLSAISVDGPFFVYSNLGQEVLQPGQSFPFQASFTPNGATGPLTGSVSVTTTPASTETLPLSGTGTLGYLTPQFSALEFLSQVGKSAMPRLVTLRNNTTYSVDVQSVQFSNPAYSLSGGAVPPFTVAPGDETTVRITCTPTHLGAHDGRVTFLTSGQSTVIDVTCTGAEPLYVTSKTMFGPVPMGVVETGVFGLTNLGVDPITINAISVTGPAAGDFTLSPPFAAPQVLAPGDSSYDPSQIQFKPSQVGARTATVTVETNSPLTPVVTFTLSGEGFIADLTLHPTQLDFGALVTNLEHTATINVTNNGSNTVVARVAMTGPFKRDSFWQPLTVQSGATVPLTIRTSSKDVGPVTGTLVIHASDPPIVVPLTAEFVAPSLVFEVDDPVLDLGTVPVGTTSAPAKVVVRNASPNMLPLTRIGTTHLGFTLTGPSQAVLAPGEALELEVTFTATQVGPASGEIWVYTTSDEPSPVEPPQPTATFPLRAQAIQSAPGGGGCSSGRNGTVSSALLVAMLLPGLRRRRATRRSFRASTSRA